jgi:single-stranded DNA-binding protein
MLQELGRLVYDVEVRDVGDPGAEKKVLNNRIAISNGKNDSTFIDIVAWNGTAELIGKHFKKGFEILVSGKLINTQKKKGDLEYEGVAILVNHVTFTNGNPKEFNVDDDVADFL